MNPTVRQVISCVVFLCLVNFFSDAVEVVTPIGKIIGSDHLRTRHGKVIYSFTGIPYAQPPVGNLRFKEPQPVKPWQEPLNATKEGPDCPQVNVFGCSDQCNKIYGEEDCLTLNVHSPKVDPTAKLAVMVFIHGGAYMIKAGGSARPDFILDKDIVLVDFNYRLGALGFMTTGDGVVPANLGMKDQVLALKWVRDNIQNFGGDPNLITIFGHSVGASSTHLLMISPLAKGLIHRGISMSGTGTASWGVIPGQLAKERTKAVAALCGCPTEPSQKLLECLQKIPADIIVEMQDQFKSRHFNPVVGFAPVIEAATSKDAFLISDPHNTDSDIPWMTGATSSEAIFIVSPILAAMERNDFDIRHQLDYILPRAFLLDLKFFGDDDPSVFKRIKEFYLGDEPVGRTNIQKLVAMFSDARFLARAVIAASKHKGETYLYYYDFLSSVSFTSIFGNGTIKGVSHGDDQLNIFPMSNVFPNRTWSETEMKVSEEMVDLLTNFAKYGKPTVNTSIQWEPTEKNTKSNKYLHISADGSFTQKENLLPSRVEFWKSLDDRPKASA